MVLSAFALRIAPDTAASAIDGTWLTPSFLTSLAILITAITGLVVALRTQRTTTQTAAVVESSHQTAKENQTDIREVKTQTNGTVSALQERITQLETALAGRYAGGAAVGAVPPVALVPPAAE